ncbi:MAG: hypothetical protein OXR66_00790 [Candidatus Woesearchaeota archaeon]|nr:hypothetical protein [Candidatus Woesearchaeota archaeon]
MQALLRDEIELDIELKEWGNGYGIRISKSTAQKIGAVKGEKMTCKLTKKSTDGSDIFGIIEGTYAPFKREYEDRF